MNVEAYDNPVDMDGSSPQLSSTAELIVMLLEDYERLVVTVFGKTPQEVQLVKNDLIRDMEVKTGKLVGVESVRYRRYRSAR